MFVELVFVTASFIEVDVNLMGFDRFLEKLNLLLLSLVFIIFQRH